MWTQRRGVNLDQAPAVDTEHEHLIAVRLLLARQQWDAALALTVRLLTVADAEGRVASKIEVLLLQALAHLGQGQRAAACGDMTQALELAAPGGYTRVFVDEGAPIAAVLREVAADSRLQGYRQRVLAAFPAALDAAAPVQPPKRLAHSVQVLAEPLSERELEVLRLVAAGHANRAIAAALTIEVGTVKRHIHNLLGKLGAPSRTAAVARARALGLL
jgi:LuxR family maltose regulon positive regulatory protein